MYDLKTTQIIVNALNNYSEEIEKVKNQIVEDFNKKQVQQEQPVPQVPKVEKEPKENTKKD